MRLLLIATLALAVLTAACGGGGGGGNDNVDELEAQLADVCTETGEVDLDDVIKIDSPDPGDRIEAPFHSTGEVAVFQEMFWITVIKADGQRIINYPVRVDDGDAEADGQTLFPYDVSVPFFVQEETRACLWVYRRNVEEPEEAVRVPVVLIPSEPGETPQ